MNWYLRVLQNYAVFGGRARRKEYWMFALINLLIYIALALVERATGMRASAEDFGVLTGLYSLAVLLPSIAVGVRRLHDTSRSGWWMLLVFIPILGAVVLLIFFVMDSTPSQNQYGPNPKGVAA